MPLRFLVTLLLPLLFLVSCNTENALENSAKTEEISNQEETVTNNQIAEHLASVAGKVPGVDSATALVAGSYAIVGIDVEDQLDSSRVGTIKYSVTEALRTDPYGKTAVVMADPDIMERIKTLREKIGQGEPTQAVFDEIASLVARIFPLLPKEDQPIEQERNIEIDDEENNNLNEIQKKHSTENNEG